MNNNFKKGNLERVALKMSTSLELQEVLTSITQGLVDEFDASFARIWLLGPGDLCPKCCKADSCISRKQCLHLEASAGIYTRINGEYRRIPLGAFKIGRIAQGDGPISTNDALGDDRIPNKKWLKEKRLRSFAGHPLIFRDELLGVLAMFSRRVMGQEEFDWIAHFANQAAVAIKNAQLFKSMRKKQALFSGILDISKEAIISTDGSEHIIIFNKGAEEIFKYSQEEVIGKSIDLIIPEKFHEVHRRHIAGFVRSDLTSREKGKRGEVSGRRKNGEVFPAEASISKLQLDGQLILTVTLRDITERNQAEIKLRDALSEVQQLKDRIQSENVYLQEEIKLKHNFDEIISKSKSFKKILRNVEQVAATDATVLILGETGTGKELIARALHTISPRKDRPLIKVNCAALPPNLIESELFGHEKGAFTGALSQKKGRFELADIGTIFLDEIGDLPLDLQAKLLRVLQEAEFERVGGTRTIKVDVRVIAATNRDLLQAVQAGQFREDLYYRLNVFPILLPPLRERPEDIPFLANHFIKKSCAKLRKNISTVPQQVMKTLQAYHFPGNVRELENIIERAIILAKEQTLQLDESLESLKRTVGFTESAGTLEEVDRNHTLVVLEKTNWRIEGKQGAALCLGLNPSTLRSRMQKLGIRRFKQIS